MTFVGSKILRCQDDLPGAAVTVYVSGKSCFLNACSQNIGNYCLDTDALKSIRKACGLTQNDVGIALGVSQREYQRWESGACVIQLNRLFQLCDLFHCDVYSFLKFDLEVHDND